jgi:hypothetical protein
VGKRVSHRPKRLFHAIVTCGVALTACGNGTSMDAGTDDAAVDAKKDTGPGTFPDGSVEAQADAFDPSDSSGGMDVNTIKPPPPPPPIIH